MSELVADRIKDIGITLDDPANTALVVLPEVTDHRERPLHGIRLSMHTDTILNLLRILHGLDMPGLKIEGRVINSNQFDHLRSHPTFRFYMQGRMERFDGGNNPEIIALVTPKDLDLAEDEVGRLIALTFSPRSLMDEIRHQVGFYSVQDLLRRWETGAPGGDFEPLFGGCNEFRIGSDTADEPELSALAVEISRQLRSMDANIGQIPLSLFNPTSPRLNSIANIYQIQPLSKYNFTPLDNFPLDNNFKTSKIIFTSKITPVEKFDNFNLIKPSINSGNSGK